MDQYWTRRISICMRLRDNGCWIDWKLGLPAKRSSSGSRLAGTKPALLWNTRETGGMPLSVVLVKTRCQRFPKKYHTPASRKTLQS